METSSTSSSSTSSISTTSSSAHSVSCRHCPLLGSPHSAVSGRRREPRCDETANVAASIPRAPSPLVDTPVEAGTQGLRSTASATFLEAGLVAGGAPWRLLRLSGAVDGRRLSAGETVDPVASGEDAFARTLVAAGLLRPRLRAHRDVDDVDVVIPVHDDAVALRQLLLQLSGLARHGGRRRIDEPDVSRRVRAQFTASPCPPRGQRRPCRGPQRRGARDVDDRWSGSSTPTSSLDDPRQRCASTGRAHFDDPLVARGGAADSRRCRGLSCATGSSTTSARWTWVRPAASWSRCGRIPYVPQCLSDGATRRLRRRASTSALRSVRTSTSSGACTTRVARSLRRAARRHASRPRQRGGRGSPRRLDYGRSSARLARRHGDAHGPVRVDPGPLVGVARLLLAAGPCSALRGPSAVARPDCCERAPETIDGDARRRDERHQAGLIGAGGPLARAVVRTYGPLLVLAALRAPWLRRTRWPCSSWARRGGGAHE